MTNQAACWERKNDFSVCYIKRSAFKERNGTALKCSVSPPTPWPWQSYDINIKKKFLHVRRQVGTGTKPFAHSLSWPYSGLLLGFQWKTFRVATKVASTLAPNCIYWNRSVDTFSQQPPFLYRRVAISHRKRIIFRSHSKLQAFLSSLSLTVLSPLFSRSSVLATRPAGPRSFTL